MSEDDLEGTDTIKINEKKHDYKKVVIDRRSNSGNFIAKEKYNGKQIHVKDRFDVGLDLRTGDKHYVKIEEEGSIAVGQITGYGNQGAAARWEELTQEREIDSPPERGEFFRGTISRISSSNNRIIEPDEAEIDRILVNRGEPGDEVEVRIRKVHGKTLKGRVSKFVSKSDEGDNLSENERKEVQETVRSVEYDGNKNDLINGPL